VSQRIGRNGNRNQNENENQNQNQNQNQNRNRNRNQNQTQTKKKKKKPKPKPKPEKTIQTQTNEHNNERRNQSRCPRQTIHPTKEEQNSSIAVSHTCHEQQQHDLCVTLSTSRVQRCGQVRWDLGVEREAELLVNAKQNLPVSSERNSI
jgi:hypothetical protein